MDQVRINNHQERLFIIRLPLSKAPAILTPQNAGGGQIVILAGETRLVDAELWNRVKDHPVYQNLLNRRLITVNGEEPAPGGDEKFTSHGDTLKPPPNLDPELDEEAAAKDPMKPVLAYGDGPKTTTRRGGRKAPAKAAPAAPDAK